MHWPGQNKHIVSETVVLEKKTNVRLHNFMIVNRQSSNTNKMVVSIGDYTTSLGIATVIFFNLPLIQMSEYIVM